MPDVLGKKRRGRGLHLTVGWRGVRAQGRGTLHQSKNIQESGSVWHGGVEKNISGRNPTGQVQPKDSEDSSMACRREGGWVKHRLARYRSSSVI